LRHLPVLLSLVRLTPRLWSGSGNRYMYAAVVVKNNLYETRFQVRAD
jgi:hypothetical protein